jgi:flagellar protein FliO/FliZ
LLLGVAPGRVSSLHAFSEDELEFDEIKRESFSQRLADVVKQRQAKQGGKVDT